MITRRWYWLICVFFFGCGSEQKVEPSTLELQQSETTSENTDATDESGSQHETIYLPNNNVTQNPTGDISYSLLMNRNPDCGQYVGEYRATIYDLQQNILLTSQLTITATETHCHFVSNNIPNHDLGGDTTTGKLFASKVTVNSSPYTLTVPRHPDFSGNTQYIGKIAGRLTLNGILLNGVDLDMDSAFCYHPDITTSLNIGLGTRQQCGLNADWYAVPANNPDIATLDEYTGHSYAGRYHYHGDNHGLSFHSHETASDSDLDNNIDPSGSPVIGFAPDGFPIYGHYIYDAELTGLRKVTSSWQIINSERITASGASVTAPPIGSHPRGLFVEDWQYVEGSGDLDECNGMTDAYGNYGYYYTEQYPFGPICNKAIPDPSFTLESNKFNGE